MTETKHRRPARRTLAHGQPLRRPMARRTPQRRPTAGQRPRPAVGRLWQLVVCGALLLGVVAIKLTAPDTLEPYRQRLLTLMGGDTDFTAAFSAVGHAFDGSLTGALVVSWFMYHKLHLGKRIGLTTGVSLLIFFGARFGLEFMKNPQVAEEVGMTLNIGQWLSVPLILLGIYLIATSGKRKEAF